MSPAAGAPPAALTTARLVARAWEPADAPALLRLIRTEYDRLRRDFPRTLAAVFDEASAAQFIVDRRRAWQERTGFQFSLWPLADPTRCIGFVSLRDIKWGAHDVPAAELAYCLAAPYEGRGLLREALRVILPAGFGVGLEKVFARTLPDNHRSQQTLRALGFRYAGRLRKEFRTGEGRSVDIDYFDLLADELLLAGT